ncbi:Signal recognition particle protein [Salix suchowensis]|nr:Signal recognition particle protein [Salix suchowensis]
MLFFYQWAVARLVLTKSPVIFISTGEHMDKFEVFDVKPSASSLLEFRRLFLWINCRSFCKCCQKGFLS